METSRPDPAIENDVLHLGSATKLTPEQIAKAIARHKHHHSDAPRQAAAQPSGKKQKGK